MNRNAGMFLVFLALILLSVLVVNGLYFNTPVMEAPQNQTKISAEKGSDTGDQIATNLSINQEQEYDPDLVEVLIGFESQSQKQSEAVKENNQIVSKLMEILKAADLEKIETQGFRVYPTSKYDKEKEESIRYYVVNNQIKFTSKNLGELPVLLADLLDAGANRVINLNYDLENKEKALEEVTNSALNSLKEKASFMASNLDKENYRIKEINLGTQNIYRSNSPMKTMLRSEALDQNSEVPLAEQKVNIRVSVSARIELY